MSGDLGGQDNLRFFHSSYLVFYSDEYAGKDFDQIYNALNEANIWEYAEKFHIGLIVCYRSTYKSDFWFHMVKSAPRTSVSYESLEKTLEDYFQEAVKKQIIEIQKKKFKSII